MRTSLKTVLPFFLVIILLMLVVFQMDKTQREEAAKKQLNATVQQVTKTLQSNLSQVVADLAFLAGQTKTQDVLMKHISPHANHLCEEFFRFATLNKRYSQIRLLDVTGYEIVRVDYKDGAAHCVPESQLQDKSDRYYFLESEKLKPGQIYQSQFDLNIERGQVEVPYNPTIRFVTPVTDYLGGVVGYMVLNFNAREMLSGIYSALKRRRGDVRILNKEGYFLFSNNFSQNWGFMFNRPQFSAAKQSPELWKKINQTTSEGFDFDGKYYAIERICGAHSCQKGNRDIVLPTDAADLPWTVVGALSQSKLVGYSWWQSQWPYFISALLIAVAFFALRVSWKLNNSFKQVVEREFMLERSKQRFEKLLKSVPDGLLVVNERGLIEAVNPVAETIFETARDQLVGQSAESFISVDIAESLHNDSAQNTSEPIRITRNDPLEYFSKTGQKKYLEIMVDPVVFDDERLAIVLVRDVTDSLAFQDKLRQTQKLEAIGQLTGGVAHDFNNLLGIMIGNLELLEMETAGNEAVQGRVGKLMKAANSAADLTQKLLAVSRKKPLNIEKVDIEEVMSYVMDILNRVIKGNVKINCHCMPNLPAVLVDSNELTNALINLVVNARDAMPDGGEIQIKVEPTYLDEQYSKSVAGDVLPGKYVLIEIQDTGEGIPKELIGKVLEPFFTTKDKGKGTGLGLAMIYGFIKQSKGHMRIYSEVGIGTSVHLYLPIDTQTTDTNVIPEQSVDFHNSLAGYRVLIVDDEPDLAEVLKDYLKSEGMQTEIVSSADRAWDKLKEKTFDLVFSDIVMPGEMSGIQLYDKIKAEGVDVKVILSSGFSEDMLLKQHELDENMVFVRKPYNREGVMNALMKALNRDGY